MAAATTLPSTTLKATQSTHAKVPILASQNQSMFPVIDSPGLILLSGLRRQEYLGTCWYLSDFVFIVHDTNRALQL